MSRRIKITRNTVAGGRDVFAGEKYTVPDDISERDANLLYSLGKCVRLKPADKPAEKAEPDDKPAEKAEPDDNA